LLAACRAVSSRGLAAVGDEIVQRASWDDIVLPQDSIDQLRELCAAVRARGIVLDEWGLASSPTVGTGLTALFAGPSGTGKTMSAGIIANELGLPIFRIDLARVVSKWIGETEKNLDQVFKAAEDSNAVLFLDEADALLGKRSEIKDSHDRYANLEISYLLQKMELYDGVAILATNMPQQLDQAFIRRLSFKVFFPLPDEKQRLAIWQTLWPNSLPRTEEVDLPQLARFKLTGGNIRNVLLAAAYLAASDGAAVTMRHLRHALRREYQKLGKEIGEEATQA
jgi:SpoVK/Ycf46/Vps4 family AAA+-type ATPase